MIDAIRHRGPDGEALEAGPGHVFGHARLAIIDIESGRQPMLSASGRWLIAFNGEIYNFRELRSEIGGRYRFQTRSDTEVVLACVETLGVQAALAALDGMFAIALFDREHRQLHLARDHFGIKPLYYSKLERSNVAFASEIKALVAAGTPPPIDRTAVVTQLLCRFIPAPYTGRQGIAKLRPGEWLTFDTDGQLLGTPQRILPRARSEAAGEDPEVTAQLLRRAVQHQTVSDVPIGSLLSGGIDSALVTQFAAQINPALHSYCVGYGEDDRATEFDEAAESARLIGSEHRNIVVSADDYASALSSCIHHLEEPVATTSLVSYMLLCEAVARERKVVLAGQGADEPWAGYTRHRFEALLQHYGPAMRTLAPIGQLAASRARLREILGALGDETLRWVAYRSLYPLARLRDLLGGATVDEALHRIADALAWSDGQAPEVARVGAFERLCLRDCFTDLADNLLLLGDKLSMAHGLEVRVPMLDVAYATHVLRLPLRRRRRGLLMQRGKAQHKDVALSSLPADVVNRPKRGFETPLQRWLAGELGRAVTAQLKSPSAPVAGLLPVAELLGASATTSTGVDYERQQQIFSLWLTDEWTKLYR
jgi:asparagine synthase (glutamine-hydrolysing)